MRPRAALAALVLASTAATATGCSVGAQSSAQVQDDEQVPFGLLDGDAPALIPDVSDTASEAVSLCFIDGSKIMSVRTALDPPVDLTAVAAALQQPPGHVSGSLRTAVGEQLVRDVQLSGGVAQVDLRPAIADLGGDEQVLAVAQLVCTLTSRAGVGLVTFTLSGTPVDIPRADGSLTSGPVSRDDYANVLR